MLDISATKYVDHRLKDIQLNMYLMKAMDGWSEMALRIALVRDEDPQPKWNVLSELLGVKASKMESEVFGQSTFCFKSHI